MLHKITLVHDGWHINALEEKQMCEIKKKQFDFLKEFINYILNKKQKYKASQGENKSSMESNCTFDSIS